MNRIKASRTSVALLIVAALAPTSCALLNPTNESTGQQTPAPPNVSTTFTSSTGSTSGRSGNDSPTSASRLHVVGSPDTTLGIGASRALASSFQTGAGLVPTDGVVWTSSDEAIVSINPTTSVARGVAKGTAIITVALQADPSVKAQLTVNVSDPNGVSVIRVTPDQAKLEVGKTQALAAQVVLGTGEIKSNVTWAVSDPRIASVDASGVVTGIALGTVQVLASYALDPNYKGQATIRVTGAGNATPPPEVAATPCATSCPVKAPDDGPGTVAIKKPGVWVDQVNPTSLALTYVKFFNPSQGVAAGPGTLLTTSDAGTTWTKSTLPAALTSISKVNYQAVDSGWLTDGNVIYLSNGSSIKVLVDFKARYGLTIGDIERTSVTEGYVLCTNGALYKTTNAGVDWVGVDAPAAPAPAPLATHTPTPVATPTPGTVPLATPTPAAAFALLDYNYQSSTYVSQLAVSPTGGMMFSVGHSQSCQNSQTKGYYTCSTSNFYVKSDAGWATTAGTSGFNTLLFTSAKEGWRLGTSFERTVDGGATWLPANVSAPGAIGFTSPNFMLFTDPNYGFVGTGGGFYETNDDGRTWIATKFENFGNCALAILDDTHRWAVGANGGIKRYVVL